MSKKVLILTIGCSLNPWAKMFHTSRETWDRFELPGVETVFYFGNPVKPDTNKAIYFPINEAYATMGDKLLRALEWALKNRQWDYLARVNGSCYVDKRELLNHVQALPQENLFAGLIQPVDKLYGAAWCWGGGQFLLSRDVVQKIVDGKDKFRHDIMEDVAISLCATALGIPFTSGKACSIDREDDKWRYVCYGTETFTSDKIVIAPGQFFYRVKQDLRRHVDEYIMRELAKLIP